MINKYKYLLAENPIINYSKQRDEFIYSVKHSKRALILVKSLDISDLLKCSESKSQTYTLVYTSFSTGLPEFYELSIADNIDIQEHKISVVLKDAGKWYKNYLIWEDKRNNKAGIEPVLKDYNENTPGLKILYGASLNKWLAVYKSKYFVFNSLTEMNITLNKDFNIPENYLKKGYVNLIEELFNF